MSDRHAFVRVLPWFSCVLALTLLVPAGVLGAATGSRDPAAEDYWLYPVVTVLVFATIPLVGAVVAARLPHNPYGWLWCALGVVYGLVALLNQLGDVTPVPRWVLSLAGGWSFLAFLTLLTFVFLLFPTGRLPSRRWRWLTRTAVGLAALTAVGAPFAPREDGPADDTPWVVQGALGERVAAALDAAVIGLFVLGFVATTSVLFRYRTAGPVERQQLKWFALAAVVVGVTIVLDLVGPVFPAPVWAIVDAVTFALIPLGMGIAVLRYRLYDIDRLISRAVSYAVLTAALLLLYLAAVTVLRRLLTPLTGTTDLAVAASTLAVAAAFHPARRSVQAAVDRRFDRARYDAARTVGDYAARLRTSVDLDEVATGLRETVTVAVGPTRVGLWLRSDVPAGRSSP